VKIVSPLSQRRVAPWLLLASAAGAFGCPQLLDDGFETRRLSDPDGGPLCLEAGCGLPRSGGSGGDSSPGADAGASGVGGAPNDGAGAGGAAGSGAAGAAGSAGVGSAGAGSAGSAGAGAGGVGGAAASGGSAGASAGGAAGAGSQPACWTLELADPTHDASSNCLGIYGWNQIQRDTDQGSTTVALSYQNGDPCFAGTVDSVGWGATYTLTFANEAAWNATSAGVTGFDFLYSGAQQPASLHVIYKDDRAIDFCRAIGPGETSVPFSDGHPSCSSTGSTVVLTKLSEIILAFPVNSQPYDVNFCVQIRALD
jgi:hypothetical protein